MANYNKKFNMNPLNFRLNRKNTNKLASIEEKIDAAYKQDARTLKAYQQKMRIKNLEAKLLFYFRNIN